MSRPNRPGEPRTAPLFKVPQTPAPLNPIPSSSPAFATPAHPIRPFNPAPLSKPSILSILLPPATLRPLAFRTFTKKYSLTLTSSALQILAAFIGRYCGSQWREDGLAEHVLEEVAKNWKRNGGGVIVDGEGLELKDILKALESIMSGGRIIKGKELSRQNSFALGDSQDSMMNPALAARPVTLNRDDSQASLGMSTLDVGDEDDEEGLRDIRQWLKVISAYDQPRLIYNVGKKHFDKDPSKPSLLPPPSHKTQLFRNRYNLVHQRLLRNESFQVPSMTRSHIPSLRRTSSTLATPQQAYKLTPIANLLGRKGTNHLLLGLLTISPTGTLAINDLTGSIALDLTHAKTVPEDGAWFVPGMIVVVDGVYEEDDISGGLGGGGGVGGTIGGKFIGFTVGGPPCERRQVTLGVGGSNANGDRTAGGGFGWVDFLGIGSERAVGSRMRKIEARLCGSSLSHDDQDRLNRNKIVILGEVNLDQPRTFLALNKILSIYSSLPLSSIPINFILTGNFTSHAVMARGGSSGGSIEYKEYFDTLASLLSEHPTLLSHSTFVFVPGDNDAWASSFAAGAATPLPRKPVPEMFTSRIRRAFATANAETEKEHGGKGDGEAVWTSNPARLSLFGPAHEIVLFRDDVSARLRRNAIRFASASNGEADAEGDIAMTPAVSSLLPPPSSPPEEDGITSAQSSSSPLGMDIEANEPTLTPDILTARKLVKTLLDQGHLSPFRTATRPVLWDYGSALQLYPLPTALVLADGDASAFCVTYEGCVVMNPGRLVARGRKGVAKWVEYEIGGRTGTVREVDF